ncbi:hypothetical protein [Mesoterricola sediminis]|uniref:hypothetical protein n=1 Tax=Mesoterricola sediminis TaxID=2927980 RepID=UPI00292ED564|nr:hypothetical protein [Mesoterricola sediminis]
MRIERANQFVLALVAAIPLGAQSMHQPAKDEHSFIIPSPITTVSPQQSSLPGEYYHFQGLGNSKKLTLMRDGTYAIAHSACGGPIGLAYGTWELSGGSITLMPIHETTSMKPSPKHLLVVKRSGQLCFVPDYAVGYYETHGACFFTAFCPLNWDLFGPPEHR